MKKILGLLILVFSLLFVSSSQAQTRVLVGVGGGDLYSNVYGAVLGGIELPIGNHLEIDGGGQLSPRVSLAGFTINLEKKLNLGTGWAYNYDGVGRVWLTHSFGLDAGIVRSGYAVTATSKNENFVNAGISYRRVWFGTPTRFTFDYKQEITNGLLPNGDETNNLKGGSVTIDTRFGCASVLCFRFRTNIQGGVVSNQGNPACDGSGAPNPQHLPLCPRSKATSGGASFNLLLEFPRHKGTENDPF